jgi:hypothetical protein
MRGQRAQKSVFDREALNSRSYAVSGEICSQARRTLTVRCHVLVSTQRKSALTRWRDRPSPTPRSVPPLHGRADMRTSVKHPTRSLDSDPRRSLAVATRVGIQRVGRSETKDVRSRAWQQNVAASCWHCNRLGAACEADFGVAGAGARFVRNCTLSRGMGPDAACGDLRDARPVL